MTEDQLLAQVAYERSKGLLVGKALGTVYRRENRTEPYVCIPPALVITDSDGSTWTMGFRYREHQGQYEFSVLKNDIDTGEFASRIEYRDGTVKIFGQYGWKSLSRARTSFI